MATHAPVVVVANPTAGGGKAGKLIGKADAILRDLRIEHTILVTRSAAEMEATVKDAAQGGAGIVAALGGDGTVSCAANGLLGSDSALAVLPGGTGDDFAKAIGASQFDSAVRLLADPQVRAVDVVKVTAGTIVRHFVNVAGAGFDSEVNETANAMTLRLGGTATYMVALVRTLSRFHPARYRITVDDRSFEGDAMLAVVSNGVSYGGGMRVTPDAILDDGQMDVCVVQAVSKAAFLRAFPRVFAGTHTTHPKVKMFRGTRVAIAANRQLLVYADGERVGPLPAEFEVKAKALPVVTGPEAKGLR